MSGLQPIGEAYPSLERFFRDKVGVRIMSLKILMEQLVRVSSPGNTPDGQEVKAIMMNAGQILATDPSSEAIRPILPDLRRNRYLPVHRGDTWLFMKTSESFFIVDHERYATAFGGKINLLDFDYAEMTSLHPLFQVLGLEHRYLSRNVETETVVSEAASNLPCDFTPYFQQRAYALSWYVSVVLRLLSLTFTLQLCDLLSKSEILQQERTLPQVANVYRSPTLRQYVDQLDRENS